MSTSTPTLAGVRRRIKRAARRNTGLGMELYIRGLGARGRMSLPEVHAFRRLAEMYLARPEFRASPQTRTEQVRTSYDGGQVRGEWVERGPSTRGEKVLLYVHGGAFIAFSPRSHRGMVSELAERSGRSVFSVDYRLAPEHVFPKAADDVLRAYAWLLSTGVPASRIVVAGDSAGGHLALGLTPRAVRAGLPAPAGVVGLSPVVDPSMRLSQIWEVARSGKQAFAQAGRATVGLYHHGVRRDDPELLLTEDDLSVLPPVLIQASASEPLVADANAYTEAVLAAGGSCELQTWPRKPHVFQVGFRISSDSSDALDKIAEFIKKQA